MSNSRRRQRHKRLLLSATICAAPLYYLALTSFCLSQQFHATNGQPTTSSSSFAQQQPPHSNKQYQQQQQPLRSSAPLVATSLVSGNNNNNNDNQQQSFVGHSSLSMLQQQIAQSLPLIRHQPQIIANQASSADLDNVIESTTTPIMSIGVAGVTSKLVATSSCQLPPTWAGRWYQSNKEPIRVTNTEISDKGACRDQKGDKYLFEYAGNKQPSSSSSSSSFQSTTTQPCLVCLVINERHLNVLQYKESSCQPIPANYYNRTTNNLLLDEDHSLLDSICSDITGDAQLESLFRLDTPAIECPINGQYAFTYDNCREPQSSLDSCIDKKQLNFKFSACPDVPGSESKSEVLKCYADWSEGNNYYMIGRLEHNHQDKGKFRCFVYEKSQDGKFIQMAQSLEESCYGLINANEGPKTLRLALKPPTADKCHFPAYIQSQSENWLSVDNLLIYMFNQNSSRYQVKETKEGNVIEEATCLQQFTHPQAHTHPHHNPQQQVITKRRYSSSSSSSSYPQVDQSSQQVSARTTINEVVYLVQITKNCQTTNYCVKFYKRSNGIVQIDYFNTSPSDNQCRNAVIGPPQTQIITSTNLEYQRCPFEGAYTIEASIESDLTYNPSNIFICPRQSFLTAQCDNPTRLRIHSRCSTAKVFNKNLYCLGSWTTNGWMRLLLADDDRQRYSAWYRNYGAPQVSLQDGVDTQGQALQYQQPGITRSQQLIAASSGNQYLVNSMAPIIDLQIALITPLPIAAKAMSVRLTRRHECSDLRGYLNQQGTYGGGQQVQVSPVSPLANSISSYHQASSANISYKFIAHNSPSSILILIVSLLMPMFIRVNGIHNL